MARRTLTSGWGHPSSTSPLEKEMSRGPEDTFKHTVIIPSLKLIPDCDFFIKEAASIRGIADIIGNVNGHYFAWEIKKDEESSKETTGRIVLQRYKLDRTNKNNGVGRIVHPGNFEECYQELLNLSAYQFDSEEN